MVPDLTVEPGALMNPIQTGARIGVTQKTLANWRWKGVGPPYIKLGEGRTAPVRYERTELLAWLESREVRSGEA